MRGDKLRHLGGIGKFKNVTMSFLLFIALSTWAADDLPIADFEGQADGLVEKKMELTLTKRYLNIPVKTGAPKRRMSLIVDGKTAREFEIELAPAAPDFWVFLDVSAFRGKKATLCVDRAPTNESTWDAIEQSDEIKGAENLYKEKLRPQFHFTSRRGCIPPAAFKSRGARSICRQCRSTR